MDNSKLIKKSIANFIPVILIHMIFTLIDKRIMITSGNLEVRLSLIHMSIYFYFFVIPIYLMIVNVLFNAKKELKSYYSDMEFGALSILGGNIVVLIINIISRYVVKIQDINLLIEFFIILIPELIMFLLIEFLGSYLVKKHDEDYEEEMLEGVTIPEREVEFYKKDEGKDKIINESQDENESETKDKEISEIIDEAQEDTAELNKEITDGVKDENVDESEDVKEESLEDINIEIEDENKAIDDSKYNEDEKI